MKGAEKKRGREREKALKNESDISFQNNNNNNNNNLLTASGLSPGGSGYFTFKLRPTYYI
jgi:hypothetical protein